jgi:uncharacterized protein (DUF1778 family)
MSGALNIATGAAVNAGAVKTTGEATSPVRPVTKAKARLPELKAERFNVRVSAAEKTLVEQAARALRVTSSQFIMEAALRSAEEVVADQIRFVLPHDQWAEFTAMLDRPAREIETLKEAAAKPRPFRER